MSKENESQAKAKGKNTWWRKVFRLYYEGFRDMTVGKTLWKIIFLKVLIMFGVLKLFFFPNYLNTTFSSDQERAEHVITEMTGSATQ